MTTELQTAEKISTELQSVEEVNRIEQYVNGLCDESEISRMAMAISTVTKISNEREAVSVNSILTRVNTIASIKTQAFERYSAAFYRRYKAIRELADNNIKPLLALKYHCISLIKSYQNELDKQNERNQANLSHAAQVQREQDQERARQAAIAGDVQAARQFAEQASQVMTPILQPEKLELPGTSIAEKYKVTITDLPAFLNAVLLGKIPFKITLLTKGKKEDSEAEVSVKVNLKEIARHIAEKNGRLNWPGVEFEMEKDFRVTRKDL